MPFDVPHNRYNARLRVRQLDASKIQLQKPQMLPIAKETVHALGRKALKIKVQNSRREESRTIQAHSQTIRRSDFVYRFDSFNRLTK